MAARHGLSPNRYGDVKVPTRQSAILVLIAEGPQGPSLLLTERVSDLTDFPGQIVFPGGVADPSDDGPVATALREAEEEVGLDVDFVQVIGCLPPLASPDSGFVVHPVLAWPEPGDVHGVGELYRGLSTSRATTAPACRSSRPHGAGRCRWARTN